MRVRLLAVVSVLVVSVGEIAALPVSAAAAGTKFLITPTSFDFGAQPLHSPSAQQVVTITNVSGVPQQISGSGGGAGVFGGVQNCQGETLAAGSSCQMYYAFTPAKLGSVSGSASGTWNGQKYTLQFRGTGTPQFRITPSGFDFGKIALGATGQQQIVNVTNLGTTATMMNGIGGGAGQFGGLQDCQGSSLAAGATCHMFYAFRPTMIGDVVTTASGTWNAQQFTIQFHGVGTGPAADDYVPLGGHRVAAVRATANTDARDTVVGGGVPADAGAVDLTVTIAGAASPGSAVVYPCGSSLPHTPTIRFRAGQAVTNHVIATPGGGKVCVRPTAGAHVTVDRDGYYPAASGFRALNPPWRRLQARSRRPVAAGAITRVHVLGGPVPQAHVRAVALNLAAAGSSGAGRITVWPCGRPSPSAPALSYPAGAAAAAMTISKVGTNGGVCVRSTRRSQLSVDVVGYYVTGTPFSTVTSQTGFNGPIGAGKVAKAHVVGGPGHIAGSARAVAVELTVSGASQTGTLTLFPCGTSAPSTTALSYSRGESTAMGITSPGAGGTVCVKSSRSAHVSVAVVGWYSDVDVT